MNFSDVRLAIFISFVGIVLMNVYIYRNLDSFSKCLDKASAISTKYKVPIAETLELCK